MEQMKTLYTFKIKPSKQGDFFELMGEVLTETSAFGANPEEARQIIIKDYGVDLKHRLELVNQREVRLYGKTPDKVSVEIEESLLNGR